MSEEKPKKSILKGLIGSIIAAIIYVAIPYTALDGLLDQIIGQIGQGVDASAIEELLYRWMVAGIPMVALAFPAWMYPKGSRGRVISWSVYTIYSIAWLLYVTNMGHLESILTIESTTVGITVLGIIVLSVISKILKGVVVFCQYHDLKRSESESNPSSKEEEIREEIRIKGRHG